MIRKNRHSASLCSASCRAPVPTPLHSAAISSYPRPPRRTTRASLRPCPDLELAQVGRRQLSVDDTILYFVHTIIDVLRVIPTAPFVSRLARVTPHYPHCPLRPTQTLLSPPRRQCLAQVTRRPRPRLEEARYSTRGPVHWAVPQSGRSPWRTSVPLARRRPCLGRHGRYRRGRAQSAPSGRERRGVHIL